NFSWASPRSLATGAARFAAGSRGTPRLVGETSALRWATLNAQAKRSLSGIRKGGRKRHFRYERLTSRGPYLSARAPQERLISPRNSRETAHFARAVGKNTVRADCVVVPTGLELRNRRVS